MINFASPEGKFGSAAPYVNFAANGALYITGAIVIGAVSLGVGSLAAYMLTSLITAIAVKILIGSIGTGLVGVLNALGSVGVTFFCAGAIFMASTVITACALKSLASKSIAYCAE